MVNYLFNFLRGTLIGIAEVIPGVSGGTIALVTGIYQRVIDQAAQAVAALLKIGKPKKLVMGIKTLDWRLLTPLLVGMVIALVLGARFIEPLLASHPIQLRALFAGLVAAGIYIPVRMVIETKAGPWKFKDLALALIAALFAFFLTGLPPAELSEPNFLVIFFAAALAICALVLPGVSGSFLLLSLGLYATTISAVNDLNIYYLSSFAAGALFGLSSFVILLRWLLKEKSRPTLVVLIGLMLGSLRALWPWQDDERNLMPVGEFIWQSLSLFIIGAAVVWLLVKLEKQLANE